MAKEKEKITVEICSSRNVRAMSGKYYVYDLKDEKYVSRVLTDKSDPKWYVNVLVADIEAGKTYVVVYEDTTEKYRFNAVWNSNGEMKVA